MLTAAASEFWDAAIETMPRDEIAALQLERLRATIDRVLNHQPLGAERSRQAGITDASDITSLDDLAAVPFAHKSDLREHYPFGLLAVPREEIVRVHASSGSHGKPTVVGYTRADLETWTELMARSMTMAGVRPGCSSTTPTATGCSPAASGSTRAASGSAPPWCPCRAGSPRVRRCSSATSGPKC